MSKAKLQAARELIQEKRYMTARVLLEAMPDDPTAQRWLLKLNEIAPTPPSHLELLSDEPAPKRRQSSSSKALLIVVVVLLLCIAGVWLLIRNRDTNRWASQSSEASAALNVFCSLRLTGMDSVSCDQWTARLLNEDISRTDSILFCERLWNANGEAYGDDSYARLFISCLADRGIYLP